MCMEDVQIGREAHADQVDIAPATASVPAIGGSPHRFALVFTAPIVGHVTYSLHNPAVLGQGINLGVGDGAIALNIKDHGRMVTKPFYAISDQAGGAPCSILFSIMPREK